MQEYTDIHSGITYERKGNTVQDLINILSTVENKSLPVELEGCDCVGAWIGKISVSTTEVLLDRYDN